MVHKLQSIKEKYRAMSNPRKIQVIMAAAGTGTTIYIAFEAIWPDISGFEVWAIYTASSVNPI
jgi:hypothetical protein